MPHEIKNYVAGRFVASTSRFDDINPVDGSLAGIVHEADKSTVDLAVQAAREALRGPWGSLSAAERGAMLNQIADGIEARFDEFVAAEIADTGKPLAQARTLDIPRGTANFRFFANLVSTSGTECFEMGTPDGSGALNYSVRKPLGVVGVISPWNLPFLLLTWKLAPAMAAGNTIIAKPSEETPATAALLAEVMHEVGIPPGVFNLVNGFGPGSAGEFVTTHPDVDAITFTGESATGSAIMRAAAGNVKALSFELGGKNAAIIFEDANLDQAVDGTVRSVFSNCGQVCLCSERVYVHQRIFDEFVARLKDRAEALRMGWPDDEQTEIGPLVSTAHRDKVLSYYELAREEGATVVTGGGIPEFGDARDQGAWVQPTILTGLEESARCVREEIFGPVCHIAPFTTEEQAVAMANDSAYGLAGAVWTTNLSRAHRVARQIEAGIVWVNTWYLRDLRTPFGGVKLSGIGREGGVHSLNFYSEPTNICIKL
ncbi:MAG: 2-hydroxymuconic semialdehyde dehydrogenase [Gammaproteobacteria bacterium]|nr:2-hydroxymuconic semialdehyde dehydrogenase [Gammaproteobacteria bacterium]MDH3430039.1 2-hydroxymuconic semialdehyde dehydrogenase [Gammaproteobacteria bacterium]